MNKKDIERKQAITLPGWEFDWKKAIIQKENEARRIIPVSDKEFIEARLIYCNEYKRITNQYGISYNRETGKSIPYIHISLWENRGDASVSFGLGIYKEIGEAVSRKNYKHLMEIGKIATDTFIKNIASSRYPDLLNARIV